MTVSANQRNMNINIFLLASVPTNLPFKRNLIPKPYYTVYVHDRLFTTL